MLEIECNNPTCDKTFLPRSGNYRNMYCSRSCSATVNNKGRQRNPPKERTCALCGETYTYVDGHRSIFCYICVDNPSNDVTIKTFTYKEYKKKCVSCEEFFISRREATLACSISCGLKYKNNFRTDLRISQWLNSEWRGGSDYGLSVTIRKYLLEQVDYSCSICGFNKRHPDDNATILEVNHINGDGTDHRPENLEVLCPNCHALTSSYRGRNKGHGRPWAYHRKSTN